jgi:cytochrome c oxidase subunit 2
VGRGAAFLVLPLLAAACTPGSITEQGRTIHGLYNLFMWIAAVVFAVVSGLVLWSVVRYRRRDDELPEQTHGHNTLELLWTLIPTLLVGVLIVATVQAQDKVLRRSPEELPIKVTGFQWSWQFDYPDGVRIVGQPKQRPTMVVPVGRTVRVELSSADVVHSFYIPKTLFKRQAIPGFPSHFDLTFDQVGTYPGQCAQFCGVAHADMLFDVKVVPQSEYESWLRANRAAQSGAAGP